MATAAISGAVGAGVLNGPMKSLQDIWELLFDKYTDNWIPKQRIKIEQDLKDYKESVIQKVGKIPEDQLKEPSVSLIGPAIEASRFYIGEPEIREMFAGLIAASMNQAFEDQVHYSFVELVKMLSPVDAKLIKYLYKSGDEAIAKIILSFSESTHNPVANHLIVWSEPMDIEASIDNLIRLGIVTVTYDNYLTNASLYDKFYNSTKYLEAKKELESQKLVLAEMLKRIGEVNGIVQEDGSVALMDDNLRQQTREKIEDNLNASIELVKGRVFLTAFGRNFCNICCS